MQCIENTDSGNFDICQLQNKNIPEMYEACRYIPYARGFNSLGFVKYHISEYLTSCQHNLFILNQKKYNKNITQLPEIYVINLERRLDRQEKMIATGLPLNFFKAVDGKELTMTDEIQSLFANNDFNFRRGVIGAALSHYTLWKQLTESNIEEMLIVEDDVEFADSFMEKYSYVYDQTKYIKDWDIVYLGWTLYDHQKQHIAKDLWNDNFPNVVPFDNKKFYGAGFFGYLLSKRGAQKLLNYTKENGIKCAIDCIPQKIANFNRYFMFPHIIKTPVYGPGTENTDTDIQTDYSTL